MAVNGWLVRYRTTVYPTMNFAVLLASCIGAAVNDVPFGVAVYVCSLVALCSVPVLFLRRLNDRYVLLALFMALYFLFFGALDLKILLFGTDLVQPPRTEFLTSAELAILAGAAALLLGYRPGVAWGDPGKQQAPAAEWSPGTLLLVGLAVWLLGTAATIYFQIFIMPSKLGFAAAKGIASMGPALTFTVMLGQMMQPVGILMLAYGYARYGHLLWTTLILVVVLTQVGVGFVEDIKIQAMMGGVLVIMTRIVVTSRLPKVWIAGMAVFLVIAFPIFQAYRAEVTGERGLDRAQALQQLGKVIDIVMASRDKVTEGHQRAESFVERASSKRNVEILFDHVGKDVPFLNGRSLVAIPLAFVPRLLIPDKEDVSVGLLFSKQILKSDSGVYISISHLGELYWNFGWAGVLLGMLALGLLLGFVGARFNLEQDVTLTRVLALLATLQPLCLGFGGTMPVSYLLWMRSMAAIGLMHMIFARKAHPGTAGSQAAVAAENPLTLRTLEPRRLQVSTNAIALPAPAPRFPNLLR